MLAVLVFSLTVYMRADPGMIKTFAKIYRGM